MDNLIERYVYAVVNRLPEKDRDEVSKELISNIYDMLPEQADENEIKKVLYQLGSPDSLAEKYRLTPNYLISPAVYSDYIRVLKWLLPLTGTLLLAVGMIIGAIDSIKDGMADIAYLIRNTLSSGISLGVSAVFQALVWTTAGFAIADRTGQKIHKNNKAVWKTNGFAIIGQTDLKTDKSKNQEWKIEELPDIQSSTKNRIPLSDTIVELVVTIIFSILAILLCYGILPIAFIIQNGDIQVHTLFSSSFLSCCIPGIVVMALLNICHDIIKIKCRRWTPLVCGSAVISSLASMGIMVPLINRADLFSAEFIAFLQSIETGGFDLLSFFGISGISPLIIFISVGIVVSSIIECCYAIYKTIKQR